MARRNNDFQTIRSEGGLLPPDLLRRVLDSKEKLVGTRPQDYGLPPGERLHEAITQSWNRLRKHWAEFRIGTKNLPVGEAGTGLTNDKWSVPLLRELSFGLLPASAAPEIGGKTYAISRFFGATAIHLVGCGVDLDRRTAGVRGAALANPHGLVQDFLNRSPTHQWAILSNGIQLRVLRDSQAISRLSYLEFDLEAIFDGEVFSDFVLLWLMAHATRFAAREGTPPESCWLEQWTKLAEEQGTRALGDLRVGVEKALQVLGQGFVGHPKNTVLRDALRNGQLTSLDLHGQLLRVVYRLIFLFVAEDRTLEGLPLLHVPDSAETARIARERYEAHYSAGRLRELAGDIRGSRHGDLWWQLNLVVGALSGDERFRSVREQLALPVLGSFLWSPDSTAALNAPSLAALDGVELANADLLDAIRNLAFTRQNQSLRPVDYRNLGAEELGGVYESLLALTPQVSGDGAKFTFAEFAGNERKTSGSYYTPDSLVQCLLDSTLEPVVEEAIRAKSAAEAEKAILALKVCDPAVGSGHFLVGAAHRLARHLARIRAAAQGEGEPSPGFYQHALRDVIGRCLYGVDINPMAAELCRVSLWLEALDPGKPLSFLEHHIRVGNSLLGTTPDLIARGLPDEAFTAIEGDEKPVCSQLKRRNKAEREGFDQRDLLRGTEHGVATDFAAITKEAEALDSTPDDTVDAVRRKADQFRRLVVSPEYKHAQRVSDAWCAAFVWAKTLATFTDVVTTGGVKRLGSDPNALIPAQTAEVERLASQYQFFHWHLAFPEVFAKGGFNCVLGNPPWERIQLEALQFFAVRRPELLSLKRSDRENAIHRLEVDDPSLYAQWKTQRRVELSSSAFLKRAGRFPLSTERNVNSYAVFTELGMSLQNAKGRLGVVSQSGIATDDNMKPLFQELVRSHRLASLYDFENRENMFPEVHSSFKFCLLTVTGGRAPQECADFVFYAGNTEDLRDASRHLALSAADIAILNPNTGTIAVFDSPAAAQLCLFVYRHFPVLIREVGATTNTWSVSIRRMFDMAYDSALFQSAENLEKFSVRADDNQVSPGPISGFKQLYEAKLLHQFDHRFATFSGGGTDLECRDATSREKSDAGFVSTPRYWVSRSDCDAKMAGTGWSKEWIVAIRQIARATDERTAICAVLPFAGVGHSCYTLTFDCATTGVVDCCIANVNAFCFDWIARQKLPGANLSAFVLKQLPLAAPETYRRAWPWVSGHRHIGEWMFPRVLELTYTAWDLEPFAQDFGFDGPPYRWDDARRFLVRCELDAAFFHLYLPADPSGEWVKAESESEKDLKRLKVSFPTPRDAVAYIMDTFPIVKRKDEEKFGAYRTKETILQIYDQMQEAIRTEGEYKTRLEPPAGDPRCCHSPRD